jgi:hypothetical protein
MMGSLKTWTVQDARDEMMLQREEMSRPGLTYEEAEAVRDGATLLVMCTANEDMFDRNIFESHIWEVTYRIKLMLEHGMFGDDPYGLIEP